MRSLFILTILLITGCTYAATEAKEEPFVLPPTVQRAAPLEDAGVELTDAWKDPDACVPQRFAADQIPYGFQYDINCPPIIYAPPRWIPPWDPGPVIKPESK